MIMNEQDKKYLEELMNKYELKTLEPTKEELHEEYIQKELKKRKMFINPLDYQLDYGGNDDNIIKEIEEDLSRKEELTNLIKNGSSNCFKH